ncbi:MAG: hypothetical protein NZM04_01725 [Methylacidiphilales bacterium]|nr:hypothetical protein [Candidatus Methylacidiphilales bacterium]
MPLAKSKELSSSGSRKLADNRSDSLYDSGECAYHGAMGAFAAGAATATLFSATIVAGAVGGFVNGAVSAAVAGGRIKDIFLSGFKGAVIGGVTASATFGIGH